MSKRSPSRSVRQRYSRSAEPVSQRALDSAREAEQAGQVARPSVEPHAAFSANASQLFGNRVVSAALWGAGPGAELGPTDDVAGPESLIHSILALGAAGVHVGDSVFTAFGNDRLASVLSDGPGADPWAPELLALGPQGGADSVGYAGSGFEDADSVWASAVDGVLSRRASGSGGGGSAQRSVDAAAQSGGRGLPGSLRAELEARFGGVDFGAVEIHTDGASQAAAESIDAAAYTMGTDIWFGQGQFAPDTERGMHLLAHELTHVLQNMRGDAQGGAGDVIDGVAVSSPSDARELEAEAVAHDVMRGDAPEIGLGLDGGLGDGLDAGAAGSEVGLVAERTPDGGHADVKPGSTAIQENQPKFITLPDGTQTELHEDGPGKYYIKGPKGERLACDAQGNPTSAALDQMAGDARGKGAGVPQPEKPAAAKPGPMEAGTKKDEGKAPGKADAHAVPEGGTGRSEGAKHTGGAPEKYAELSTGPLSKYAGEKAWHDSWKAAGAKTEAVGGTENGKLALEALGAGAADGFAQGAQAAIIDVVLNKATSKIPYASGFIAMAQIAYDPNKWFQDTIVSGVGGKLVGGWNKAFGEESDGIDRLEGVLNILEGLNNIIGIASTVCMIVAAAGFILSFICPALIPFVALAAKWGLLLGEINTVVGLALNAIRLVIVIWRAKQVAMEDANPEVQAKRAEKLKGMMTEWTADFTKRQGNNLAKKLQTQPAAKPGPAKDPTSKPAAPADGSAATATKSGWKSRLSKIGGGLKKAGDEVLGVSDGIKEAKHAVHHGHQLKEMHEAYGENKGNRGKQLDAMMAIDPNAVSKNSEKRLKDYQGRVDARTKAERAAYVKSNIAENQKALEANNEGGQRGKGELGSGHGATSRVKNGKRKLGNIDAQMQKPEFWAPENKGERKSVRRNLEKSSDPADVALAQRMKDGEAAHQGVGSVKPEPSGAPKPTEGRSWKQWYNDSQPFSGIGQGVTGAVKGTAGTVKGFGNKDNLAGNQVEANGYGHQGTGGHMGQGTAGWANTGGGGGAEKGSADPYALTGPGLFNRLTSTPAVDEEGKPRLDKDGTQVRVSALDSLTHTLSGGLGGKDEHGEDFEGVAHHWAHEQEEKLKARLAMFDAQHISVTGQLPEAPVQDEGVLDSAAASWEDYDHEIELLRARAAQAEGLKADADAEKAALESEKALVEANKAQIAGHKQELVQKEQNQSVAEQKIGEQSAKGDELGGTTGAVIGVVGGFCSGFMELCGMIPTRLTSAGAEASGGASKIKEGVQGASDSAETTKAQSQKDTATLGAHKQTTDAATQTTSQTEAQADTLTCDIQTESANTEAGKGELEAAAQDVQARIAGLEAKKEAEKSRSAAAEAEMDAWAEAHHTARTGEEESGEKEVKAIEEQAEEIEKKKSEEQDSEGPGDAPVGDFPNPIEGTVYAELAGPAPARTPSVDASAFSQGAPLPEAVRSRMDAAFGQDFGDVRVHTGDAASDAASGFNARAFAYGSDILFGSGQFAPGSKSGDELIAHELQHVVQQRTAPKEVAPKGLRLAGLGSFAEIDADRVASTIVDKLHGKNPTDGDVSAPRRGRDPEVRQNTPGTPGAGGEAGGTAMSRGRSADGNQGERGLNVSGSVNIGGVQIGGSIHADAQGVSGSAKARGNVAGVPVSAQVSNQGASAQIGGSAKADPGTGARGSAPGPEAGRGPQGNHVEGSDARVRGTSGQGGGRKSGPEGGKPHAGGGPDGPGGQATHGPNGEPKHLPGSPDPTAQVRPGAQGEKKPGANAGKGGGKAAPEGGQRDDGKDKDKGGLPQGGAANVDVADTQGGNDARGPGPGEAAGAQAAALQPGNPETAALGPAGGEVLNAVGGARALFGQAPAVGTPRDLPTLAAANFKLPKDQELQLQKTTGLTARQHRQAVEQEMDHLRGEVKSLQTDAEGYGREQKTALGTDLAARAGEAQASASAAFNAIAGSFAAARKRVADAVSVARTSIDAGGAEAQARLDAALPAGKTTLSTSYEAGKKALGDLRTKWAEPFNTMVDESCKAFGTQADTASAELAAQKAEILKAWPTEGADALGNAENEARRNAASKGIDQAVADYKNGGKAKSDAVAAQKPQYQKQVSDAVTPVEQKLESMRQDGEARLDSAYATATAQIGTDRTSANAQIDAAQTSATASLDSGEKSAKGQVSAAQGRLEGDIVRAQTGAEAQIDSAVAGLDDRYADWLQGVLDGVPADQPMLQKTAEEYLAGKRQELARFHQKVLDELLGVCESASSALAGTITVTTANIAALGQSGAGQAGTVADQQVAAIQDASGTFATSMTTVGGAVEVAIQQYVTPIPATIAAKVAETDTAIQQKKTDAAADIAAQAVAYGAELRAKIKAMVPMLTPMANAAARGVRPKLVDRAEKVFKACKGAGTDENMLYNGLRGCTALSGLALETSVWPDLHAAEGGMRAFIEDDVEGSEREIAFGYLAGNTAKAAQLELDNSMHWYGDDEDQIEKILRDLSPEDLKAMQGQEGWSNVRARLVDNLGGTDLDVTKALLAGNTARADAYRLRDKINDARADMDPDALHKALEGVDPQQLAAVQQEFHNIQNKVDPEATNVPAIKPEDAAKELGEFSTRHIDGQADVQGANKNLAEALATKGRESDEAAIHRFEVERGREGGPEQEGLEKSLYAKPELQEDLHSPDPQVRAKAEAEQKEREARIREGYAKAYGNGNANAMQDAMGNMYKDDSEGDTRRRMVQNMLSDGTNTPRVAADSIYLNATAKTGTDEAAVKRALTGMRPDEIAATSKTYGEKHGNGDPNAMAKDLGIVERNADGTRKEGGDHSGWGSELSGDDRREVEELMMGDPKYQSPQQKLALARLQKDWTVGEESTGVGQWMLSSTNERADFDRNFARMEESAKAMNPDGTFKGATPDEQAKNKLAFERAAGDSGVNADDYRAAGDRTAGYATTGIAVVGAVVITAATFGSGAPAGAALIAAAGAAGTGVASMGVNYAMKGGRYGWEQATTDLAVTAVTAATAGGGAYLGAMNKGVGILANTTKIASETGKKVAGQVIVGAGTGFVNGVATTATTDGTWDKGFSKGMKETGKGGLKQAAMESVTNGVSTGIDETAWAKAMANKSLLAGSLAKGVSTGTAGMASSATGLGVDRARGKFKGELSDGLGTIALEGAKQFAGGFGGNVAGKSHVEPWAQRHQQETTGSTNTHDPHANETRVTPADQPVVQGDATVKPQEHVTPTAKDTVTPVADASSQPKQNVEPVAKPREHVEPVVEPTKKVADKEVHVGGDKDGMTAHLDDRTVVSSQEGAVSTHEDGAKEIRGKDGTLTRLEPDGSHKTILPDGTIVLETPTGEKAQITKEGEYVPLGPDGKPVKAAAEPTVTQREDSLISDLERLVATKKISQDEALAVIGAGDIDAQTKALGSLGEQAHKQDVLLDSILELTTKNGPDGKPLVTREEVDLAFGEKDPEAALQRLEANARRKAGETSSVLATDPKAVSTDKDGTTAATDKAVSSKDALAMHHSEFVGDVAAQKAIFDAAAEAVSRMKAAGDEIVQGMPGAEVSSLRKRNDFDQFVTEVVKKQKNENYESIGKMCDIVRGRFNVETGADVELVVSRLKEKFGADVVKVKPPREGYPRWHINVVDAQTGLVHEWQVGTKNTTQFFETKSVVIPDTITAFKGQPDFHDGVYKLLNKVTDPVVRTKYGIDDMLPQYKQLAEETGSVSREKPVPENYAERYAEMTKSINEKLAAIEKDNPGYFNGVLTGGH